MKKENENEIEGLLKIENYPPEQKQLVIDFNNKLKEVIAADRKKAAGLSRRERIAQLEADEKSMDLIHESLGSGSWKIDFDGNGEIKNVYWNNVCRNLLGYSNEEDFPNELESVTDLLYADDREKTLDLFNASISDRTGTVFFDVDFRIYTNDKGIRWFRAAGRCSRNGEGTPVKMVGLLKDIDDAKKSEERLQEQFEIVQALSRDYLNVFKVNVNERTAEVLKLDGYVTSILKPDDVVKYPYDALVRQYVRERVYPEEQTSMLRQMKFETVLRRLDKNPEYVSGYRVIDNGEIHYYQFKYIKMPQKDGNYKVIAGFKNVDEVINAAKERESLIILSESDIMTGLLNRGSGEKKASHEIEVGCAGMFCILDIDKFKSINDTYGHSIGDKVIVSVAKSLKESFRERDIVFRLGGDEFAVFTPGTITHETGMEMIERFFDKVGKIDIPELGDRKITTSVGAAIIDADSGISFEKLYKMADECVYKSKKFAENKVIFCEDEQ